MDMDYPEEDLGDLVKGRDPASKSGGKPAPKAARTREDLRGDDAGLMAEFDALYETATAGFPGGARKMPFVPDSAQMRRMVDSLRHAMDPSQAGWKTRVDTRGLTLAENRAVMLAMAQFRAGANADLEVPELEEYREKTLIAEGLKEKPKLAPAAPKSEDAPAPAGAEPAAETKGQPDRQPAAAGAPSAGRSEQKPAQAQVPPLNQEAAAAPKAAEKRPAEPFAASQDQAPAAVMPLPGAPASNPRALAAARGGLTPAQATAQGLVSAVRGEPMIMCGDDPVDEVPADAPKAETHEARLRRLGIPPRPRTWPDVMTWPPGRDLDLLDDPGVTRRQREDYLASLRQRDAEMIERARQIDAHIQETMGPVKISKELARDPHYGVRWAVLLDEQQTRVVAKSVANWTHDRAVTLDGGVVRVGKDGFTFRRYDKPFGVGPVSDQAIQVAMAEGAARGWKSFKATGDPEFAQRVLRQAQIMNMPCEVTVLGRSIGSPKKLRFVPPPPSSKAAEPEEDPATGESATVPRDTGVNAADVMRDPDGPN